MWDLKSSDLIAERWGSHAYDPRCPSCRSALSERILTECLVMEPVLALSSPARSAVPPGSSPRRQGSAVIDGWPPLEIDFDLETTVVGGPPQDRLEVSGSPLAAAHAAVDVLLVVFVELRSVETGQHRMVGRVEDAEGNVVAQFQWQSRAESPDSRTTASP
jgi:hypothetical protein